MRTCLKALLCSYAPHCITSLRRRWHRVSKPHPSFVSFSLSILSIEKEFINYVLDTHTAKLHDKAVASFESQYFTHSFTIIKSTPVIEPAVQNSLYSIRKYYNSSNIRPINAIPRDNFCIQTHAYSETFSSMLVRLFYSTRYVFNISNVGLSLTRSFVYLSTKPK